LLVFLLLDYFLLVHEFYLSENSQKIRNQVLLETVKKMSPYQQTILAGLFPINKKQPLTCYQLSCKLKTTVQVIRIKITETMAVLLAGIRNKI
jgi:hypothetical protein